MALIKITGSNYRPLYLSDESVSAIRAPIAMPAHYILASSQYVKSRGSDLSIPVAMGKEDVIFVEGVVRNEVVAARFSGRNSAGTIGIETVEGYDGSGRVVLKELTGNTVSIEGLDKSVVFASLYNASEAHLPTFNGPLRIDIEEARITLDFSSLYHPALYGKLLRIDLSTNELFTGGYNRENGNGAAERVIQSLRAVRRA